MQTRIDVVRFPSTVATLARWGHCNPDGTMRRARGEILPSCCALASRMGGHKCPICLASVHPDARYTVTNEFGGVVRSFRGEDARDRANMVAATLEHKHGRPFDVRMVAYHVRNPNGTTSLYTPASTYNDRPAFEWKPLRGSTQWKGWDTN